MNRTKKNHPLVPDLTSSGKIPPQARELENAVLGALLLETKAFFDIENILSAEDFYYPINQTIFKAIHRLGNKHEPIDMYTVCQELMKMEEIEAVGGPVYIAQLTDKIASAAHIEYHARIIKQKAIARKLIDEASRIIQMAYDESVDIEEVIEEYEKSFSGITTDSCGFQSVDMAEALKIFTQYANQLQADRSAGNVIAIPTHLPKLNKVLDEGWRGGELIILGARPSMGKTQHALAMAQSAAKAGEDCFFVSIEMTLVQLITRLMLEDDEINKTNLRTGQMTKQEWETLDRRIGELFHIKMSIADHHNIRYLNNIKSEARRLHRQGKLKIMIIDYLQLIKTNLKFQSRQLEVAYITGELKSLAKELNIPIVALAQLSRPQKGSKPKEPDLEDLREAGDIEQDADIVCMLHLPSYYKQYLSDEDIKEWTSKGMFIVRKSREGVRNDTIIFYHDERYKKIWDDLSTPIEIHNRPPITPNYSFEKQEDDLPF